MLSFITRNNQFGYFRLRYDQATRRRGLRRASLARAAFARRVVFGARRAGLLKLHPGEANHACLDRTHLARLHIRPAVRVGLAPLEPATPYDDAVLCISSISS